MKKLFSLLGAFFWVACGATARGPNRPPVASAGVDQGIVFGQNAFLDASASYDPDGDPLTYTWQVAVAPAGADVERVLPSSTHHQVKTLIRPDQAGLWLIRLTVNDGRQDSLPDLMEIRVMGAGCQSDNYCNDGLWCTVDHCVKGQCQSETRNCQDSDPCTEDSCDEDADLCRHVRVEKPGAEGVALSGTCTNGADDDCDGFTDGQDGDCRSEQCSSPADCEDGIACTDDLCPNQRCSFQPNDSLCENGAFCLPGCTSQTSGCARPPQLALVCQNPIYLPPDNTAKCALTLSGGANLGQQNCLSCQALVTPTTLVETDFARNDDVSQCASQENGEVDGWRLVTGQFCYSSVTDSNGSCQLTGPNANNCCGDFACPTDSGEVALQSDKQTCADGRWRLERTFNASGMKNLRLCFDQADWGACDNDVLQVDVASERLGFYRGVFCQRNGPLKDLDRFWYTTCLDLPQELNDNPEVKIVFFLVSDHNDHRLLVDNIVLRGEAIACPTDRELIFSEDFNLTDCASELASRGWGVSGSPDCSSGFYCFDDSPMLRALNKSFSISRNIDVADFNTFELCFYFGEDRADSGESLTVEIDRGQGWQQLWRHEGNFGTDGTCQRICLDFGRHVPAGIKNLSLRFTLTSNNGDRQANLDQIQLWGRRFCHPDTKVILSKLDDDDNDGTYLFESRDQGGPLTAAVLCDWQGKSEIVSSIDYLTPVIQPSNVPYDWLCQNAASLHITQPATIDTDNGTITGVEPNDILFRTLRQVSQTTVPELGVFVFDSIRIAADVRVTGSRALVLLACRDVEITGVINACADGQQAGPGGGAGGQPTQDGQGCGYGGAGAANGYSDSGGGGAGLSDRGGDGGAGAGVQGGLGGQPCGNDQLIPIVAGSGGGGGSPAGVGGIGGGGGGAVQISAGGFINIVSPGGINVCGAGGSKPLGDGGSGGGGGSGGAILLEALQVLGDGNLAANGGGGGGGDIWGDGQVTSEAGENGPFGFARAGGGAGSGSDGGNGGAGGWANDFAGSTGASAQNAGGGGGAAGLVRINTLSGQSAFSGSISGWHTLGRTARKN